jgi:GTPase SAR1 family protein
MGICSAKPAEHGQFAQIEQAENARVEKEGVATRSAESKVVKLLLLGTGESGKSTIFKQMQILYQQGFSDYEKSTYRHVVRRNVVESMQTLLGGAARFGYKLSNPESEAAAKAMLDLDPLAAEFWVPQIVRYIQVLWVEQAIKTSFQNRSKLQLLDSAEYLFENIERIGAPDYTPNKSDILHARLRTSGIVERLFKINGVDFKFLDVGGQRNERRKWIHCFEGVTAVIFVAAISEYDQVLYEDEKENRLMEAIKVFENISNNKYFIKTAMILFLNKIDLFQDKVQRVKLKDACFPDYEGDNTYEDASNFIRKKFLEVNKQPRDIFAHLTCATDTKNVERVFDACKRVILKRNLEKLGLA